MKNEIIYILHGWAIDSDNEKKWAEFRELLETKGFRTRFLPIPGLTTQLDEVWTLETYIAWLEKWLPKDEKVILLGHSFGGQISSTFCAQYPDRVSKLILIDSSGIIDKSVQKVVKRAIFGALAKFGKRFFKREIFRKILYKMAREQDYLKANEIQRQTMANVLRAQVTEILPQIECPTLIIWGKRDTITPFSFAKVFKSKIKNSVLHSIETARHAPQFTHPQETVAAIGAFLQ